MRNNIKKVIAILICLFMLVTMASCGAKRRSIRKASKMVENLSIQEKIAQMIMPAFRNWTVEEDKTEKITELKPEIAEAITKYGFGGVILFSDNTQGTAQTTELIYDIKEASLASSAQIPLFVAVDQEGGSVARLGTGTSGPGNMALGAANDIENTKAMASLLGSELVAEGFNLDFAPVMDVNNNPGNPVIGVRSFSDDPNIVVDMGTAFIEGLHSQNLITALKHFPGHGDTVIDSHSGLPCINKSLDELKEFELIPFKAGIKAKTDMIMTAHIQYPQIEKETYTSISTGEEIALPATLSKEIITNLLREELGFDGVVITDALGMGAISEHFEPLDAARLAINAGVDMLLMPIEVLSEEDLDLYGEYIDGIAQMVDNKEIDEAVIDAAVTRILALKFARGLMEEEPVAKDVQISKALGIVGSKENHDKEWDITSKTITMIKNDGVIPVKTNSNSTVAFFAVYSNEGTAMEYAFNKLKLEAVVDKSAEYEVSSFTKKTKLDESQKMLVDSADIIIVDSESSSTANMDPENSGGWQASFIDDLIAYSHEKGKKVVLISIKLPYDVTRYQAADAILIAYNAKGMDELPTRFNGETKTYGPNLPVAIGAIFGEYVPSATLPINIFKLNSTYEYTHDILYQRGFGLSYD